MIQAFQRRYLQYLRSKPATVMTQPPKHEPYLTFAERWRFRRWLGWKYGPECAYCQRYMEVRWMTIDHIQPISRGGAMRDVRNMVLACLECNRKKGNAWPGTLNRPS